MVDISEIDGFFQTVRNTLSHDFLFVSGAPKSGTTWLQKALDAHPKIACSGEGHFANALFHALDQSVTFYHQQLDRVNGEVYQGQGYYEYFTEAEYQFLARSAVALIFAKRPMNKNVRYIGDKTPANALYLPRLHLAFPNAKFIHIVRDPRDVIVSTMKHAERVDYKITNRKEYIKLSALRWLEHNEKAFAFGQRHPQQFCWLRYRDLLDDFENSFVGVLKFLGLEVVPEEVEICKQASAFDALSGGRQRGVEDVKSFYRKGVRGDWKNYLSREEAELAVSVCQPMIGKLGFMDDGAQNMLPPQHQQYAPQPQA